MKNKNIYSYFTSFILAIFLFGCTDLFINPNSSSSTAADTSAASSASKLKITITSPVSNDSVGYTGNVISYNLTKDTGIDFLELYVNGVIHKWIPANSNGSQPTIVLSLDSTLIGSTISFYLIYYDKDGGSARSDTVKNLLVTEIRTPPYPPYNLSFTTLSNNSINLSWSDSSIGTAPGYEIWRKDGFYGSFQIHLVASPNSFNINDNLTSDTTIYYYKIRGINKLGTSAFSAILSTGGDGSLRSIPPPTNVVAKATSANSILITWNYNGPQINYYRVEKRYSWSSYTVIANINGNYTQYTDSTSGLVPSTDYYYRIKAISSSDSSWSPDIYVKTPSN